MKAKSKLRPSVLVCNLCLDGRLQQFTPDKLQSVLVRLCHAAEAGPNCEISDGACILWSGSHALHTS